MRRDWIAGLVLLGLAAAYYRMTADIPRSQLSDAVGAVSFPRLLAISLAVLSVILVAAGALKRVPVTPEAAKQKAAEDRHGFLRAGGALLIGVGYLLVVSLIGYPLAVALLIVAMLLYTGKNLSWGVVVTGIVAGIFFWLLFGVVFSIPVPQGIWPRLVGL